MSLRWYGHDGVTYVHEDTDILTHGVEKILLKENALLKEKIKRLESTVRNYALYVPLELVMLLRS